MGEPEGKGSKTKSERYNSIPIGLYYSSTGNGNITTTRKQSHGTTHDTELGENKQNLSLDSCEQ